MRAMNKMRVLSAFIVAAAATLGARQSLPDLGIVNARIFTGVSSAKWADALVIQGDRIAAIGSDAEVGARARAAARVIDAQGRLIVPGFNDAHAHPGAVPPHVRLEGPPAVAHDPSWEEVIDRVRNAVPKAQKATWIIGQIGASVLLNPKATRFALDEISGDRPVGLRSWHGHGVLFNTAALRILNVSETETDPPGGFFARMPDGKTVTGLAHEYADCVLWQRLATLAGADAQLREYKRFAAEAASLGVTSVQAMMTSYPTVEAARLFSKAQSPVRIRVIEFPLGGPTTWRRLARVPGPPTRVSVSGVKFIVDGTPIERLMFLRAPYSDAPNARGRLNFAEADLRTSLEAALAGGVQPMLHAVGDAAIDAVLSALEATGGEKWRPLRPRIEHGDMLEPPHFDRAKRMGVTIVQNPSHFMLGALVRHRVGVRIERAFMVKSIVTGGVPFAIGSDGPLNPFVNMMFAAINEANPSEALTVEEALVAYTRGAAAAELMENQKGTLARGMLADLVVLSQDIFKVPPPELPKTSAAITIVGGQVVHESK